MIILASAIDGVSYDALAVSSYDTFAPPLDS